MTKEFIPYEQALALKELGFNEPCFGYYYTLNGKDWKFAEKSEYYRLDDEINIGGKFSLLTQLYQQAFRWFREKHDLHSCVAPVYEDETSKVIVYWFWIQGFDSFEEEDINYKTPEEAELACLIKLIETVKTKHFA